MYMHTVGIRRYRFADLQTLLARASPERSGDQLAGVAARLPRNGQRPIWRWLRFRCATFSNSRWYPTKLMKSPD